MALLLACTTTSTFGKKSDAGSDDTSFINKTACNRLDSDIIVVPVVYGFGYRLFQMGLASFEARKKDFCLVFRWLTNEEFSGKFSQAFDNSAIILDASGDKDVVVIHDKYDELSLASKQRLEAAMEERDYSIDLPTVHERLIESGYFKNFGPYIRAKMKGLKPSRSLMLALKKVRKSHLINAYIGLHLRTIDSANESKRFEQFALDMQKQLDESLNDFYKHAAVNASNEVYVAGDRIEIIEQARDSLESKVDTPHG